MLERGYVAVPPASITRLQTPPPAVSPTHLIHKTFSQPQKTRFWQAELAGADTYQHQCLTPNNFHYGNQNNQHNVN